MARDGWQPWHQMLKELRYTIHQLFHLGKLFPQGVWSPPLQMEEKYLVFRVSVRFKWRCN